MESTDDTLGSVTTEGVTDGSSATRALTTRQFVDFDGDGYRDILITDNPDEWAVYYGNNTDRPRACWNPRAGHFENVREGTYQGDLDYSRCRWR